MKPTPRIIELVAALLAAAAEPTAAGVKALPPVEAAIVDGVHPSLDAALGSAAARALPDSVREDREHMGGVFALASRAGGYVYSHGVGRRGRDALTIRLRVPAGASLVAIWHTHGAPGAERRLFSPEDTRLAEALGVPIYLALPDGSLRVFAAGDPKLPHSRAAGSGPAALRGAAAGRAVVPPAARAGRNSVRPGHGASVLRSPRQSGLRRAIGTAPRADRARSRGSARRAHRPARGGPR